jgi:hypothetical protein
MGCHSNMTEKELWKKVSTEGNIDPKTHLEMMNKIIKQMAKDGVKPAEGLKAAAPAAMAAEAVKEAAPAAAEAPAVKE